jgi:hypothetical protein
MTDLYIHSSWSQRSMLAIRAAAAAAAAAAFPTGTMLALPLDFE